MIRKFWQGLNRKKQDILCIALNGGRLEGAVFSPADRAVVKVVTGKLADTGRKDMDMDLLEQEVRQLIEENRLTTVRKIVFVLEEDCVFLRRLVLPQMPLRELREAARWEAEEYMPFNGQEYCFDVSTIPAVDGMQAVVFAAAPQELVTGLQQVSRALQLELLAVTARPLAQAAFVQQQRGSFLLLQASKGEIILDGFVEGMPAARLNAAMDKESAAIKIAALTEQIWQKWGIRLRNIFYTQDCAEGAALSAGLREITGEQYCLTAVDFGDGVGWQGEFLSEEERRQKACEIMAAVGGAVMAADGLEGINFVRGSISDRRKLQTVRYLTAGLLLATAAVWGGVYACSVYEGSRIEGLRQQIASQQVWQERSITARNLERSIQERDRRIKTLEKDSPSWGALLEAFGRTIPSGCWLSKVRQQEEKQDKGLLLYGSAQTPEAVEKFIDRLQSCGMFDNVELLESRETEQGKTDYTVKAAKESRDDE